MRNATSDPIVSARLLTALLLGAGALAAVPSSAGAQDVAPGCWSGTLARDGLTWDVGLRVTRDGGDDLAAAIDVDALWRARLPLPSFRSDGADLAFNLPWSMGRFEGRRRDEGISGTVTFRDGRTELLALGRSDCWTPRTVDLRWESGEAVVAGSLHLPPGPGPFPAVAVLHGGGDSSRQSPPYAFWGDFLPRHGVAVLLYDKRGNGASTGDWRAVGFEERARDVANGLARIRERPEIDGERTGLLAVSQGSWVAGLVAARDPGVGFVAHVSGPAVTVLEADTYAVESRLRREGWADAAVEERLRLWRLNARVAREPTSDESWRRLQEAVEEAREREWFRREPYEPERESEWRTWYGHVLDHDPRPTLEALEIPMLWIYGAMDGQSDPARNLEILEGYRRRGKDYAIALYPAAGHGLLVPVDARGRDGPFLTTAPGFFPDLLRWLEGRLAGSEP